jgi:hypothetical protein
MNIDRHNYEECFILYWDNELTASQKQAVENFVKENQDLEEEFTILGQTRFAPDNNIQLQEKEFLLNNSFINITSYEEQLLNYIDDEITPDQRKEVERFAGQYSAVKQELALLQKTKLQPEAEVIFPDKSILYRREENADGYRHRVISMTWFRVAVAAAVILIAGFATFRLINTNKNGDAPPIVKIDDPKDQSPVKKADESISNPDKQIAKDAKKDPVISAKEEVKRTGDNTVVPMTSTAKRKNKNNLPNEGNRDTQTITPNDVIAEVDIPNVKKDNSKAANVESEKANTHFEDDDVTKSTTPTFANYTPPQEKDGGGLKEFLRKTTRVFERRTRIQTTTDDNKLLVGAFAVSLK